MIARIARISFSVCTAATLLLAAGAASAEPPPPAGPDYSRPGFYIGLDGVFANEYISKDLRSATAGLVGVDNGSGLNVRGGYRLASWVALEAMYEWTHNFDSTVGTIRPVSYDIATHNALVNAKFVLPMWRIQPYVILGIGAQYAKFHDRTGVFGDDEDWSFVGRPGFGVDLYLTENWVANAEVAGMLAQSDYRSISGSLDRLFYLSIGGGLSYRF